MVNLPPLLLGVCCPREQVSNRMMMLQKLAARGGACEDEARRADNRVGQCRASHEVPYVSDKGCVVDSRDQRDVSPCFMGD